MLRIKAMLRELLRPAYNAFTYDMEMWRDDLTGLPTRPYLVKRLDELALRLGKDIHDITVLHIDLDHFKLVNDLFKSHEHGNFVIRQLADQISSLLGPNDFAVRAGGDEFFMVLVNQGSKYLAYARAIEIGKSLLIKYSQSSQIPADALGISIGGGWTTNYDELVRYSHQTSHHHMVLVDWADRATYKMKQDPNLEWTVYFYKPELWQDELDRQQKLSELVQSIRDQKFAVAYQPILDLRTGRIHSAEALFRPMGWNPEMNLEADIDAIEEMTGLHSMWQGVMHLVCYDLRSLRNLDPDLKLHVNISELQLNGELPSSAEDVMSDFGIPTQNLVFEITERRGFSENANAGETLKLLREMGIGLELDDWGKGKTSLDSLLVSPYFDGIKIDQFLIASLDGREAQVIVRHVIGMAHELGMTITAEGVETFKQLEMVRQLGCDFAQGHFICPPTTQMELAERMIRPAQF